MKKIFLLLFTLASFLKPFAQLNQSLNASEILLAMQKLNTLGSVLYIAAHPDDENTRLLAYLANERKFRTAYLSITRGDGGQNLIGKEQGELLGLIRTQELLAARRTDGAEQFFTRANDFGYSKNPEETFAIWNKDSIMADVVYAIRKFRPDVIICRFPTTGEGGHGHHTASAILALEAFDLAADPTKFPEQLKYVGVWQTRRIFWNTFNFGSTNTTAPDQLKIDVGVYNPLLGKGYGEIASESRSMHKSQGFGSARQRGSTLEYFKLLKGDSVKEDLFEGIDISWERLSEAPQVPESKTAGGKFKSLIRLVDGAINSFRPLSPEKSLHMMIDVHKRLLEMDEKEPEQKYWKHVKLRETEKLIIACAGLWMEAVASDYAVIPGQDLSLSINVLCRNKTEVKLDAISYLGQTDTVTSIMLKDNELYTFKHKEKISEKLAYSNPYWLDLKHSNGLYNVPDFQLRGIAENAAPAKVIFSISIFGFPLKIERPVVHKYTDPVRGETYRPLEVLPPANVNISDKVFVFTGTQAKKVFITIKANTANVKGKLKLKAAKGWTVELKQDDFKLANKNDEVVLEAMVTPHTRAVDGQLQAELQIEGKGYAKSIRRVEYDHIPYQFILGEAEAGLVKIDLKTSGLNIAYIPGAGDDVPAALKQVGYQVSILTDEQLMGADLSVYDAIVTGVRAYNTNERLPLVYGRLMEYVKQGGNLVIQYNTNSRIGPLQTKIGPYPFTISRERVTDEHAKVRFLQPSHPVLNTPNKIDETDFDGWVQERGIYFASEIDSSYTRILGMNDPNEKENEGSLIIAKYGKGNFVYTGLAFFRELPAGVPGAYRLFANLLSLPHNE
jgi:LmbE family N-acetylglucosaminyl deacetylase